jgi:hypothetical protein
LQADLLNKPASQSPQVFVFVPTVMQDGAKVLIKPGKREAIKTAHDTPALAGHAKAFNLYELALIGAGADNSSSGDL